MESLHYNLCSISTPFYGNSDTETSDLGKNVEMCEFGNILHAYKLTSINSIKIINCEFWYIGGFMLSIRSICTEKTNITFKWKFIIHSFM